jgi:predicted O-methyltransferase YrrM
MSTEEIPGWFNFADLYDEAVATAAPGDTLVEVGVWHGRSLIYLAHAARGSGKRLVIHGIDHFLGDDSTGPAPTDLYEICQRNLEAAGVADLVNLQALGSFCASGFFSDASLHFVFIDAAHDEASVRSDITHWLPKIKPGGILAGHDIHAPGVAAAVAALLPGWERVGPCWKYSVPL